MAKRKAPSIHSRAARRATSPSIDTDKSLKDVPLPTRNTHARPSVLAAQHAAGISKKSKRGRKSQMSAKARRRHEKGLEMAAAVIERTQEKVEKSRGRNRNVKDRSRAWEDINKGAEKATEDAAVTKEKNGGEEKDAGWETDEDMGAAEESLSAPVQDAPVALEPAQIPLPPMDDDDEIL